MTKIATCILTLLVVVGASFPVGSLLAPTPRAQAEAVTVVGGVGSVAERAISAATRMIEQSIGALEFKEYVLDEIAFLVAQRILQQMVRSTISWINSGFQGSPAFVTDLQGYLLNIADQTAGEIIYGSDLGFLCRPLQLDVRIALAKYYDQRHNLGKQVQCTLSGVVNNVEGFLAGDFLAGGWPGWLEMVLRPQNNIYGATAIAGVYLENEILRRQTIAETKLDWGQGFLSWEECPTPAGGSGAVAGARNVAAAGSVIPTDTTTSGTNGLTTGGAIGTPSGASNYIQGSNPFYTQPSNTSGTGVTTVSGPSGSSGGTVNQTSNATGGTGGSGGTPAASGGTTNTTSGGVTGGSPTSGGTPGCKIVTPGSLIADQLKFNLTTGQRTLISADELNEVISALFSQLATQALQGVGGLLGVSRSSGGSPSFLDRMGDGLYDDNLGSTDGNLIGSTITGETDYQRIWQAVVTRANGVIASATAGGTCGNNPSIVTQATQIRNAASALINASMVNVARLEDLEDRYNDAETPAERQTIANEFSTLERSGTLHTPITNITAEDDADDDLERLDRLAQDIEQCPPPDPLQSNASGGTTIVLGPGLPLDWPAYGLIPALASPVAAAAVVGSTLTEDLFRALTSEEEYATPLPALLTQASVSELCPPRAAKFPNKVLSNTTLANVITRLKGEALTKTQEQSYIYVEKNGVGELHFIEEGDDAHACIYAVDLLAAQATNPSRLISLHTHPQSTVKGDAPPSPLDMIAQQQLIQSGVPTSVEFMAVDSETSWKYVGSPNYANTLSLLVTLAEKMSTSAQWRTAVEEEVARVGGAKDELRRLAGFHYATKQAALGAYGSTVAQWATQASANAMYKITEIEMIYLMQSLTSGQLAQLLSLHAGLGGVIVRNPQ